MAQTTTHPKSAPHEIRANILYTDHGDRPYWNIKEMAQELNSNDDISINIDGKRGMYQSNHNHLDSIRALLMTLILYMNIVFTVVLVMSRNYLY